jgi:GNAT superfamily N-acetyltransferase
MSGVNIRRAEPGDAGTIYTLLRALAEFEDLLGKFRLTPEKVTRDVFGANPAMAAALAFDGETPVGIATWYWTYSSFAAQRGLFIEDIFVVPEQRGQGLGKAFFRFLAAEAKRHDAIRLDWLVLDWNEKAMAFYRGLGGRPVKEWLIYRLESEALDILAAGWGKT